MSRLQRRRQSAAKRGSYAYRRPDGAGWDVVVDSEWALGPRGLSLTRRQAIAIAYSIGVSAKPRMRVEVA